MDTGIELCPATRELRAVSQRSELTFKHNALRGRHGWLRLTPAYSVRIVEQILAAHGARARRVFEPFSGSGTTPLCAAYRGLDAVATDINPFLIWLARAKSAHYADAELAAFARAARQICARLGRARPRLGALPPLANIERWWNPGELAFIAALAAEIARAPSGPAHDLLRVSFCRTLIALSNAAFNHQSMSFKPASAALGEGVSRGALADERARFVAQFASDVETVALGAAENPLGCARIEQSDARGLAGIGVGPAAFDLLITSPPYPNRMSYVRELRPYMYWLGFLDKAEQAGELDWQAIGGTWGIATSRLLAWTPSGAHVPRYLFPILEKIRASHPKNGELMARYVHKYFEDMFVHFRAAARLVRRGGSAHYIVGNSSFYGVLVPAERLYVDQLLAAGFRHAQAEVIRKRNSKKELLEFHVRAER